MSDLISSLANDVLRDVVFAEDHIAFDFEGGGRLSCFVRPRVMFEGFHDQPGDAEYQSALRGLIGSAGR
jgi:hypothetical protein